MAEVSNEFLAEMLRRIQGDIPKLKIDVREVCNRVGHIELQLAGLETRMADFSVRLDPRDEQMKKVIRRLDLTDGSN